VWEQRGRKKIKSVTECECVITVSNESLIGIVYEDPHSQFSYHEVLIQVMHSVKLKADVLEHLLQQNKSRMCKTVENH
jgi:hypothetical protein